MITWHKTCLLYGTVFQQSTYLEDKTMKWETPSYNDIRFGFEVTMYINNK